jgi:hypothetical protein
MKSVKHIIIIGWLLPLLLAALGAPVRAEVKAEAQEYLTKGDAVMLISATDFMKKRVGELLSWTVGYDVSKVNRVKLTPTINYVRVEPKRLPPDGRTIMELSASVDDPGGLKNIAGVRADLSSIGRLPNTMLVDNGLFGDTQADDGVYTLQASVATRVLSGSKDITIAVANRKGWLALAKTSLDIKKDPTITEVKVAPERALANGRTLVTITVKVDNPGRIEDVNRVAADLSGLGLGQSSLFLNNGEWGDAAANDDTWTLQFPLPESVAAGSYQIPLQVENLAGGSGTGRTAITVYK